MRVLVQRVAQASVSVNDSCIGSIGKGVLLLCGVKQGDTPESTDFLAEKCAVLRIFNDEAGKMNRSLLDVGGEALVISQFTLYGDCRKGRRPSYVEAAGPDLGRSLYLRFVESLRRLVPNVQTGKFGAHMEISLVNDGPVTLLLER